MSMTIEKAAEWFENRAKNTPMQGAKSMFELVAVLLREKAEKEKGCEYCTGVVKTFPTHCDGEAYITKLTPLPAIDLMTGETAKTADPPFFAIRIQSDEMSEDFVPIRFCPKCGRELKEVE